MGTTVDPGLAAPHPAATPAPPPAPPPSFPPAGISLPSFQAHRTADAKAQPYFRHGARCSSWPPGPTFCLCGGSSLAPSHQALGSYPAPRRGRGSVPSRPQVADGCRFSLRPAPLGEQQSEAQTTQDSRGRWAARHRSARRGGCAVQGPCRRERPARCPRMRNSAVPLFHGLSQLVCFLLAG